VNYWLLKTEPETYSFADLVRKGRDTWDGVRSFQARSNIKAMKPGDMVFIYHSGKTKAIVGTARVVSLPYPDPADSRFLWVDVEAGEELPNPVSLAEIKADSRFIDWALVRQSRLSVVPVRPITWTTILEMGGAFKIKGAT